MTGLRSPLAARLKAVRRAAGLTQRDLAERTLLSAEFVSRIEREVAVPSLDALIRLCDALGCTPNDLLLPEPRGGAVDKLYERLQRSKPEAARRAIHAAEAVLAYERSGDRRR